MNRAVELIREHAGKVVPPSQVLGKLLVVLGDEGHQRTEVEKVMKSDATLTAEILRQANSSQFRGREVSDIGRALLRLGEDQLSRIAIRASAACMKVEEVEGYGMHGGGLWLNSLRSAIAAEMLAERTVGVDTGVAYTAGLLLDVGKRILGRELEAQLEAAMESSEGKSFVEVERTLLGCDHAELGSKMARKWKLPESLCCALRWHHQPTEAKEHVALTWVCHIADFVALNLGGGGSVEGMGYVLEPGWQQHIEISEKELIGMVTTVYDEAEKIMNLFDG